MLPPELRILIYNEVVISCFPGFRDDQLIPVPKFLASDLEYSDRVQMDMRPKFLFREPALLNTCRQIRAEVLRLYYGKYGFLVRVNSFGHYRAFASWLRRTGKDGVAALRHIVYRGVADHVTSVSGPDQSFVVGGNPHRRRRAPLPPIPVVVEVSIRPPQKSPDSVYRIETRIIAPDYNWFNPQIAEGKLDAIRQVVTERIEASTIKEGGLDRDTYLAIWHIVHGVLSQPFPGEEEL
ncbi:hypothetical protein W97_06824 [Coniosporium apollinis CBS 100218]|uniref:Uncharacterized protein n=1 Tax=Coniosporium apollinis (strain CBS 100218) TaxID=1168221 RepID=R7Z1A3_CONA1|nr:uncharacterized protein W97_06824 [Coniosporium apollinis CBS 100218]EON67681.1 hypothetical protein W97_06824 [Coniosporium apollinis CBS 100218]